MHIKGYIISRSFLLINIDFESFMQVFIYKKKLYESFPRVGPTNRKEQLQNSFQAARYSGLFLASGAAHYCDGDFLARHDHLPYEELLPG